MKQTGHRSVQMVRRYIRDAACSGRTARASWVCEDATTVRSIATLVVTHKCRARERRPAPNKSRLGSIITTWPGRWTRRREAILPRPVRSSWTCNYSKVARLSKGRLRWTSWSASRAREELSSPPPRTHIFSVLVLRRADGADIRFSVLCSLSRGRGANLREMGNGLATEDVPEVRLQDRDRPCLPIQGASSPVTSSRQSEANRRGISSR